jgi:hypothetical protein
MSTKIVYSKHPPSERCGVAYFAALVAKHVGGKHVNNFNGFSKCDEFIINMDIWELSQEDVAGLLNFVESGLAKKIILIMHDYRFSYLEDKLIAACDLVINLSGEPKLQDVANEKMLELFVPSSTEEPILALKKTNKRPVSLTFGFFTPRKKSFRMYLSFYEYMLEKYPEWYHIIVASAHVGDNANESQWLEHLLNSPSVMLLNFLPNALLSELIHTADLGVCFYPTGIMSNNAAPMSFFSQKKTVITCHGELTPEPYKDFTLDISQLKQIDFKQMGKFQTMGEKAHEHYWSNHSWSVFVEKMYSALQGKLDEKKPIQLRSSERRTARAR